jgi:hypothetical protein
MDNIRAKQDAFRDDVKVRDIKDWLRKNPGFAASVAAESIKARRDAPDPVQDQLKHANDFLGKISDAMRSSVFLLQKNVFGMKTTKVGKDGVISDKSAHQEILDIVNDTASHRTFMKSATEDMSAAIMGAWKSVTTKRGFADLLLGNPTEGGWRDAGRKYKDALEQYRSDRWLQDKAAGPDKELLIKKFGSEKAANKGIETEFAEQQKIARELKAAKAEELRRRQVGMQDDEINSEAGGKLIDKIADLTVKFARYQPTRAGTFLEHDIEPGYHKMKPDDDHFNANQSVHRDFKTKGPDVDLTEKYEPSGFNVFKTNPAREAMQAVPEAGYKVMRSNRDQPMEFNNVDIDVTNRGTVMNSQKKAKQWLAANPTEEVSAPNVFRINPARAAAQEAGVTPEEVSEEAEQRHQETKALEEEQNGILRDIRDSLTSMVKKDEEKGPQEANGKGGSLLEDVVDTAGALGTAGKVLRGGGGLLSAAAPYALPAAGVAAAGAAGYGAGMLINKGWESFTGNSIGNSLYNVFGDDDKVAESLKGKPVVPKGKVVPMPPQMASNRLEESRQVVETLKDEKAQKKGDVAVNAPTTVNNNVTNNTPGSGPTFDIRNRDNTISEYLKSRYQPR